MSLIKDTVKCKVCGYEIKWVWLLPDAKVEIFPPNEDYYHPQIYRSSGNYQIVLQCPNCRNYISEYYNNDGKRLINFSLDS